MKNARKKPNPQAPGIADDATKAPSTPHEPAILGFSFDTSPWLRRLPWIIAAVCWVFYLGGIQNHAPRGDGSELAAAAYTLGVTHPTGYPLFTLLGHLFCQLPLPIEAAAKVALMVSLFGAGAVLMTIRLGWALLQRSVDVSANPKAWYLLTNLAGLTFGLSSVVYTQCRVAEVYSLHVFLMSFSFWFMLRFEETGQRRMVSLAAIFMALGLAHHMTTSQLLPAALIYLLARDPRFFLSRYLPLGILAGLGGALFYLYLPLADLTTKGFPWGGTSDPHLFWRHVTGAQYQHYLYEDAATTWRHILEIPMILGENLHVLSVFIPLGIVAAVKHWGRFWVFVLAYLAFANLHLLGYNVSDYQVYYTAPLMSYTLLALVGLAWSLNHLMNWRKAAFLRRASVPALLALPVIAAVVSLIHGGFLVERYHNEYPLGRDYGNEVTSILPAGSIVLQRGDTYNYSAWYHQNVLQQGRDVAILNAGRLRDQWYVDWTKKRWPWLTFQRSGNRRHILERTLKQHLGKRRIFSKGLAERKRFRPHGPYRFICRGYVQELVRSENGKAEGPMFKEAVLSDTIRGSKAARWKRRFTPEETILLAFRWETVPSKPVTLEWVGPDGQIMETRALESKNRWISLKTKDRPLGTWHVRATMNKRLYMDLAFEITSGVD